MSVFRTNIYIRIPIGTLVIGRHSNDFPFPHTLTTNKTKIYYPDHPFFSRRFTIKLRKRFPNQYIVEFESSKPVGTFYVDLDSCSFLTKEQVEKLDKGKPNPYPRNTLDTLRDLNIDISPTADEEYEEELRSMKLDVLDHLENIGRDIGNIEVQIRRHQKQVHVLRKQIPIDQEKIGNLSEAIGKLLAQLNNLRWTRKDLEQRFHKTYPESDSIEASSGSSKPVFTNWYRKSQSRKHTPQKWWDMNKMPVSEDGIEGTRTEKEIEDILYGLKHWPELEPSEARIYALKHFSDPIIMRMVKIWESGHGVLSNQARISALEKIFDSMSKSG